MPTQRDVRDIAEVLRAAKAAGRPAVCLIGAGCSASAGIPTAAGFVDRIRDQFPSHFHRAADPSYAQCMAALGEGFRRQMIMQAVNDAKVNWAHVAIAQLIKHGYVGRVLTTNFDTLIQQACALVGVYPAVYDLASGPRFVQHFVASPSVFHLHGQYSGFVLLNTNDAMNNHAETLRPVFQSIGAGQPWLIAGYSGTTDPVFTQLASIKQFEYEAYWLNYHDSPLAPHVRQFLEATPSAHLVNGYDADTFFVNLARELECFPPEFLGMPFQHMLEQLNTLADWPFQTHILGQPVADQSVDFLDGAKQLVNAASRYFEEGKKVRRSSVASPRALRAAFFFFSGDFDRAIGVAPKKTLEHSVDAIVSQAIAARAGLRMQPLLAKSIAIPDEIRTELKRARERDSSNTYAAFLEGLVAVTDAELSSDPAERLSLCARALRKFRSARTFAQAWPVAYATWGAALRIAIDAHEKLGQASDASRLRKALADLQSEFEAVLGAHERAAPGSARFFTALMNNNMAENPELQELLRRPPLALRTHVRQPPRITPAQTTLTDHM